MLDLHLDKDKFEFIIRDTKRPKDAMRIASEAVRDKFDVVVAVGGDGTINEIVQGINHAEIVLGIIPGGSGNGLARHLEIPLEAEKVLKNRYIAPV